MVLFLIKNKSKTNKQANKQTKQFKQAKNSLEIAQQLDVVLISDYSVYFLVQTVSDVFITRELRVIVKVEISLNLARLLKFEQSYFTNKRRH